MKQLDMESNQVTAQLGQAIKALQFTERSAMLLEFKSPESANRFRKYSEEKDLLAHICAFAKIQPHTYCSVLCFVPCDGSFSPEDKAQLRALESDQGLEEGSIISAAWIKNLALQKHNQKTANVKLTCTSPEAANHLLTQ